jgi:hypothetical protein
VDGFTYIGCRKSCLAHRRSSAEEWWAHNPQVRGSKPLADIECMSGPCFRFLFHCLPAVALWPLLHFSPACTTCSLALPIVTLGLCFRQPVAVNSSPFLFVTFTSVLAFPRFAGNTLPVKGFCGSYQYAYAYQYGGRYRPPTSSDRISQRIAPKVLHHGFLVVARHPTNIYK